MNNRRHILQVILIGTLLLLTLTACSKDANKSAEKEITVVTSPPYLPFVYEEDGEMKGYEPAIWEEIGKRAEVDIKWETTDFSGLLGMIDSDRADVVSAQLTPNEERVKRYDFSSPYNYSGYVVVVKEDNDDIKKIEDLKGKTVGMGAGSDAINVISENFEDGEVIVENYTTATLSNMYNDVAYGRIDAIIVQNIEAYLTIKNEDIACKVLDFDLPSYGSCFAVKKGESDLLDLINSSLESMKKDGTLSKLSEEYLGADVTEGSN